MSTSKRPREVSEEDQDDEPRPGPSSPPATERSDRALLKLSSSKKGKDGSTPGIVYISRLPPGMTPQKVRHLMAKWGEVGRVYAQRKDATPGYDPHHNNKKKQKHAQANFSEAWIEFHDKSIAKTVAKMLNAEVIGGKKGDKWRDDVWTMKHLSGFKWEMLGEQVAYERQAHQARLRAEITRSKTEQGEYLRNVELARVLDKRKARKAAVDGNHGETPKASTLIPSEAKAKREYKQRKAPTAPTSTNGQMQSVLGSVFG